MFAVCTISVYQMVPGALLSAGSLRPPTPAAAVAAWPPASALDVNSLTNYIACLQGAMSYGLPTLPDTSEGTYAKGLRKL